MNVRLDGIHDFGAVLDLMPVDKAVIGVIVIPANSVTRMRVARTRSGLHCGFECGILR